MHPHLTMIAANESAADVARCADRSRRARDVARSSDRSVRSPALLALRIARPYADTRAAR
jgi:hypothetical protein